VGKTGESQGTASQKSDSRIDRVRTEKKVQLGMQGVAKEELDPTLGYLDDAELLSPETFSDLRTEDGRKRGEAQRNGCLSI